MRDQHTIISCYCVWLLTSHWKIKNISIFHCILSVSCIQQKWREKQHAFPTNILYGSWISHQKNLYWTSKSVVYFKFLLSANSLNRLRWIEALSFVVIPNPWHVNSKLSYKFAYVLEFGCQSSEVSKCSLGITQ